MLNFSNEFYVELLLSLSKIYFASFINNLQLFFPLIYRNINPTENMFVSAASFGDGWHNYHHVFPWDYRNSELWDYKLNISTAFVDLFAMIGWAYDLKTVPSEIVSKRVKRTGDGTHHIWGWNDKDLPAEDRELAEVRNKRHED